MGHRQPESHGKGKTMSASVRLCIPCIGSSLSSLAGAQARTADGHYFPLPSSFREWKGQGYIEPGGGAVRPDTHTTGEGPCACRGPIIGRSERKLAPGLSNGVLLHCLTERPPGRSEVVAVVRLFHNAFCHANNWAMSADAIVWSRALLQGSTTGTLLCRP